MNATFSRSSEHRFIANISDHVVLHISEFQIISLLSVCSVETEKYLVLVYIHFGYCPHDTFPFPKAHHRFVIGKPGLHRIPLTRVRVPYYFSIVTYCN